MADIVHLFPINAALAEVFRAVSTPAGLNSWWTRNCSGEPSEGKEFQLDFGPAYLWTATVTRCLPNSEFQLTFTQADNDWQGSSVRFSLTEKDGVTEVAFQHCGWPEANEHYRTSCYCWAMYLRIMKRNLEFGEVVPYENRLDV